MVEVGVVNNGGLVILGSMSLEYNTRLSNINLASVERPLFVMMTVWTLKSTTGDSKKSTWNCSSDSHALVTVVGLPPSMDTSTITSLLPAGVVP